jgi:hypothetical protein
MVDQEPKRSGWDSPWVQLIDLLVRSEARA